MSDHIEDRVFKGVTKAKDIGPTWVLVFILISFVVYYIWQNQEQQSRAIAYHEDLTAYQESVLAGMEEIKMEVNREFMKFDSRQDNMDARMTQQERRVFDMAKTMFALEGVLIHASLWPVRKDAETEEIIWQSARKRDMWWNESGSLGFPYNLQFEESD